MMGAQVPICSLLVLCALLYTPVKCQTNATTVSPTSFTEEPTTLPPFGTISKIQITVERSSLDIQFVFAYLEDNPFTYGGGGYYYFAYYGQFDREPCFLDRFVFQVEATDLTTGEPLPLVEFIPVYRGTCKHRYYYNRGSDVLTNVYITTTLDERDFLGLLEALDGKISQYNISIRVYTNDKASEGEFVIPSITKNEAIQAQYWYQRYNYYSSRNGFDYLFDKGIILIVFSNFIRAESVDLSAIALSNTSSHLRNSNNTVNVTGASALVTTGLVSHLPVQLSTEDVDKIAEAGICQYNESYTNYFPGCHLILPENFTIFHDDSLSRYSDYGVRRIIRTSPPSHSLYMTLHFELIGFSYDLPLEPSVPFLINTYVDGWIGGITCNSNGSNPRLYRNEEIITNITQQSAFHVLYQPFGGLVYDENVGFFTCVDEDQNTASNHIHHNKYYVFLSGGGPDSIYEVNYGENLTINVASVTPYVTHHNVYVTTEGSRSHAQLDYNMKDSKEPFTFNIFISSLRFNDAGTYEIRTNYYDNNRLVDFTIVVQVPTLDISPPVITLLDTTTVFTATCTGNTFGLKTVWVAPGLNHTIISKDSMIEIDLELSELGFDLNSIHGEQLICAVLDPDDNSTEAYVSEKRVDIQVLPDPIVITGLEDGELKFLTPGSNVHGAYFECLGYYLDDLVDLYWDIDFESGRNQKIQTDYVDGHFAAAVDGNYLTLTIFGTFYGRVTCKSEGASDFETLKPYVTVSTVEQVNGIDFIGFLNTTSSSYIGVLTDTDDDCTNRIYLDRDIPFGASTHNYIHICANGIITVGSPRMQGAFQTQPFPTNYPVINEAGNILAPFWNDHDLRTDNAGVYYAIYDSDSADSRQQQRIDYVSEFIQEKENNTFSGNYMISVMWENVPPFPQLEGRLNTYEALLITDGKSSYAVYTYNCGNLEWSETLNGHTVIGYNINPESARFNDDVPSFRNHPYSDITIPHPLTGREGTPAIGCENLRRGTIWTNVIYKVGEAKNVTHLAGIKCDEQIETDNLLDIMIANGDSGLLHLCPCTSFQAFRDTGRYSRVNLFDITLDEDYRNHWCFKRRFRTETIFCCYQRFRGALSQNKGLSTIVNFPDEQSYLDEDYILRRNCVLGKRLEKYSQKRPELTCRDYIPPAFAFCAGDPHLSSLDGARFTFNGWGEYILLKFNISGGTQFQMQTRTHPVEGSAMNATELVAFAFAMRLDEIVEARLNSEREVDILVAGNLITDDLADVNSTYETSNLVITRIAPDVVEATFRNEMGIIINSTTSMLSFTMIIPDRYKGLPIGMLGNYNDDPSDDVIRRNGTVELENIDDRLIHQVGLTWQLEDGESLFTYPDGKTFADYAHPDHIPPYLNDIIATASPEVLQICGFNPECIYDTVETGDINIGMETMGTIDKNEEDRLLANNMPPRIDGPSTLEVTVGYEARLYFNVSDDNNDFTTDFVGDLPIDAYFDQHTNYGNFSEYVFQWNPREVVEVSLEFVAIDDLEAATTLTVQVKLCGCANNGNCTLDGVLDQSSDTVILNCDCPAGWDGRFCEVDIDGCADFECFQGTDCIDVPAPGVGALCGPCPEGYEGDGAKCADINECTTTDHGCQQVCENLPGSFRCDCDEGYELISDTECTDIDECMTLNGGCHHICTNIDGGFTCSCNPGYQLSADMRTCEVEAVSLCVDNICNQTCVRLLGVEYCGCNPGYELAMDNTNCNNIDECQQNPCEHICNDSIGSFECICNEGYEVMAGGSCEDINECQVAALQRRQLCDSSQLCVNNEGSYTCECPAGTVLSGGECIKLSALFITTQPPLVEEITRNSLVVELDGHTVETFSADPESLTSPIWIFRSITAQSINLYCEFNDCPVTALPGERDRRNTYTTEDVVIINIAPGTTDTSVVFQMYVEMNGGVLSGTALQNAVQDNNLLYATAQFTIISITPLIPVEPVDPILTLEQIIGIAVGGGLGLILILFLITLVCVCCCCLRHKSRAKKYPTQGGGLEFENPAATDPQMTGSENLGKEEKADLA